MLKIIAFIFGYAILGFTCYVTMVDVATWNTVHYHLWVIAFVCYTILFGTFLFSAYIAKVVDEKIATWIFDWPTRIFLVFALGVSATLGFFIENINLCYIVDASAVFIYFLALILKSGTTKHIQTVQATQRQNRALIDELRRVSISLNIVVNNMPDEFAMQKKQVESIKEELRYLNPSSNTEALRLEESLLKQLQELKNECIAGQEILPGRLTLINACIAERKNIY